MSITILMLGKAEGKRRRVWLRMKWLDGITNSMDMKVKVKLLSRVWLFVTPWTVPYQASPSMGFSRQEYWSGLPFPSPGDLPNPEIESIPHCRQTLYPLSHQGSPRWTWVWANSGRRWRRRKPRVLAVHGVTKSRTWLSDWATSASQTQCLTKGFGLNQIRACTPSCLIPPIHSSPVCGDPGNSRSSQGHQQGCAWVAEAGWGSAEMLELISWLLKPRLAY